MWGWRSARAKSKAWEAARANALKAAEKHSWPPVTPLRTAPPAPLYGRWVDAPSDPADPAPVDAPVDAPVAEAEEIHREPTSSLMAALQAEEPDADELEPVVVVAVDDEVPAGTPAESADAEVTTLRLVPAAEEPARAPAAGIGPQPETQAEFLRLLEVVTSMCDHVIEYIEADRSERRMMIETLTQLSRTISVGVHPAGVAGPSSTPRLAPTDLSEARERILGGSMPAGPEPDIDLRATEARPEPHRPPVLTDASRPAISTEIAVEVRGRFGDRWVDGFEICEVMTTPDGPRYRLRRQRDGVVLPELFDATSIRHIETFEQLNGEQLSGPPGSWSRS